MPHKDRGEAGGSPIHSALVLKPKKSMNYPEIFPSKTRAPCGHWKKLFGLAGKRPCRDLALRGPTLNHHAQVYGGRIFPPRNQPIRPPDENPRRAYRAGPKLSFASFWAVKSALAGKWSALLPAVHWRTAKLISPAQRRSYLYFLFFPLYSSAGNPPSEIDVWPGGPVPLGQRRYV